MKTGIMDERQVPTADVRDMLCAQALAVVAGAIGQVEIGRAIEVLYSTDDVKKDVTVWARAAGHETALLTPGTLRIERGALTP